MEEKDLKKFLLKENEEFRKVYEQHQKYEKKLEKLRKKRFMNEEERMEEKKLEKKKLALKDKMYFLMTEYKKSNK